MDGHRRLLASTPTLHRRLFAHDYGIPAHDTFRRVFILLPFVGIQRCLKDGLMTMQAAGPLRMEDDEMLAADGEALRSSHDASTGQAALQMVTVYDTKARVVLAEIAVWPKLGAVGFVRRWRRVGQTERGGRR